LNVKHGFPIFSTHIEANYVRRVDEIESMDIPDDVKKQIRLLAK
jgi:hypothetical protein